MTGLFKSPKMPAALPPPPVAEVAPILPMPDPDDPLTKAKSRRAAAVKAKEASGRLSTLLSEEDRLGG